MIRMVLLFSVLAGPLSNEAAAQTALSDRPGMWISVPNGPAPVVQAPTGEAVILETPSSGPLIAGTSVPGVVLTAPEPAALITPPVVPETRPVPRPRQGIVEAAADEAPVTAVPEVASVPSDVPEAATPAAPVSSVPLEIAAETTPPVPTLLAPETRPLPRPEAATTAALAEALAAQIAAEAQAIMVATSRNLPPAEEVAPDEALAPARPQVIPEIIPEAAVRPPNPVRVLTPPTVAPLLMVAFAPGVRAEASAPMSAVLLPAQGLASRPVVRPVAFIMPPLETSPILPRLHPSGPTAQAVIGNLSSARSAPLSAVLLPSPAGQVASVPRLARSAPPARDLFPLSALPPSELPAGPESLTRLIPPPRPFAEVNAAVLMGQPMVIPVRMPAMSPSATPAFDTPVTDPEAAVELPAPDPGAVARMVDDVMICWRLADLDMEAQWARLSVDVALDETNLPSAESIRLTGFARVISGAAEEAYRAAHAALMGCAAATAAAPVTTSTTLVFDRSGVRLQ